MVEYQDNNSVASIFNYATVDATNDVALNTQQAEDVSIVEVTTVGAGGKAITFPAAIKGKILVVINKDAADAVTVKVTGQTGVAVAATKTAILVGNGTDFARVSADV